MTRANLNFVWQDAGHEPHTLFIYHNGDQYPTGLRDSYRVSDLLKIDRLWTADDFKKWVKDNYKEDVEDLGDGGQPKIYYTDGFITDYSYVFTHGHIKTRQTKIEKEEKRQPYNSVNWVEVWNWKKLIFDGTAKKFEKWLAKQK